MGVRWKEQMNPKGCYSGKVGSRGQESGIHLT